MTKDFDILPPDVPGKKKKGFFSRLFHSEDTSVKDLTPPKIEKPLKLPALPKEQKVTLPKSFLDQKKELPEKITFPKSFLDHKQDKHTDIDSIRKKLGLHERKSTKHLFHQLENEKNKDLHKEAKEYDKQHKKAKPKAKKPVKKPVKKATPIPIKKIAPVKPLPKAKKVIKIDEDALPSIKLPKKIISDPSTYLQAQKDTKKDLSKLEKESKDLLKDIRNIILEKKRKNLENVFIMPNKKHLKSIITLKEITSTKDKYHKFKESVLRNKQSFSMWLNRSLKIQKETEEALEKELYRRVTNLCELYSKKTETMIHKYHPVKAKQLDKINKQEATLNKQLEYVLETKKHLTYLKQKLKSQEGKLNTRKEALDAVDEDLQKNEENRKNFYNKKYESFEKWMNTQKANFNKEKEKYEETEKRLKLQLVKVNKFALDLKNKTKEEKAKIHPAYVQMKKDERQFDSRKNRIEKTLQKQEDSVVGKITHNQQLLDAIRNEKADLENLKSQVESGGFTNYLNRKLANVPEDTELYKSKEVAPNMDKVERFNDLIYTCKHSLETGDLINAKDTYNRIREVFVSSSFDEVQRKEIYESIRELYDDINLKILEREALRHI